MQPGGSGNSEPTSATDEFEECAPDRCGHLLRQVKEQCPPTETTLLLSIERSHALGATVLGVTGQRRRTNADALPALCSRGHIWLDGFKRWYRRSGVA
jgi:hypothetical protein